MSVPRLRRWLSPLILATTAACAPAASEDDASVTEEPLSESTFPSTCNDPVASPDGRFVLLVECALGGSGTLRRFDVAQGTTQVVAPLAFGTFGSDPGYPTPLNPPQPTQFLPTNDTSFAYLARDANNHLGAVIRDWNLERAPVWIAIPELPSGSGSLRMLALSRSSKTLAVVYAAHDGSAVGYVSVGAVTLIDATGVVPARTLTRDMLGVSLLRPQAITPAMEGESFALAVPGGSGILLPLTGGLDAGPDLVAIDDRWLVKGHALRTRDGSVRLTASHEEVVQAGAQRLVLLVHGTAPAERSVKVYGESLDLVTLSESGPPSTRLVYQTPAGTCLWLRHASADFAVTQTTTPCFDATSWGTQIHDLRPGAVGTPFELASKPSTTTLVGDELVMGFADRVERLHLASHTLSTVTLPPALKAPSLISLGGRIVALQGIESPAFGTRYWDVGTAPATALFEKGSLERPTSLAFGKVLVSRAGLGPNPGPVRLVTF